MRKFLPLFTALVFVSLTSGLMAQSGYNLKYNFEKGKTYHYLNTADGAQTQEVMGREIKMSMNNNFSVKMLVDNVKDGNIEIIASLDSGTIVSKNPMKDTTMSLEALKDKRSRISLNEYGKILNKEVLDKVGGFEGFGISQREYVKFAVLPGKEIKEGEPWNATTLDTMEIMGSGKIITSTSTTYTIVGKENLQGHDCLKLAYTSEVKSNGSAEIQGMNFTMEGTGKMTGNSYFDPSRGIMVKIDGILDNEMTLAATGQQNMIIPITQSVKVSQVLMD